MWQLTFGNEPDLRRLAYEYQQVVAGARLVPAAWLRLAVQDLGAVDDLTAAAVEHITAGVRRRVARVPRTRLTFRPPVITGASVVLRPLPTGVLAAIRGDIRAVTAQVRGGDPLPEPPGAFRPHVTIASGAQDLPGLAARLDGIRPAPAQVTVGEIALVDVADDPDRGWRTVATAALGRPARRTSGG